jgi:putative hydrolase of the HAD superfamily
VITKGDLFHQESKVARSGLAERFESVEIVAEKDEATYRRILQRGGTAPDRFLMIGNSMRSDILPVLDLGGQAVHIPYRITWAHEAVSRPEVAPPGFHTLDSIRDVPALVGRLIG